MGIGVRKSAERTLPVHLDGDTLSIEDVVGVARHNRSVKYAPSASDRIKVGREMMERLVSSREYVYGVNTGIGDLGRLHVEAEDLEQLQVNILRSHSVGVGEPASVDVVRAMMLLRANTFAKGISGVRSVTAEMVLAMLNRRVNPQVPSRGSVGASGDLAPLSHAALVLIGEGRAEFQGECLAGDEALYRAGLRPIKLVSKEALALNNGTQYSTALGCLGSADLHVLLNAAVAAAALTLEAMQGLTDSFDPRVHNARPHPGAIAVSNAVRKLIRGSSQVRGSESVTADEQRGPQDPYCLRAIPAVLGSVADALLFARGILKIEINAATDDPLFFSDSEDGVKYCCNFHAQPVALALDVLKIAAATIGNMSERRTALLTDPHHNNGLPPYLVHPDAKPGLTTGLMIAQSTAAALVSECKILSHPASTDSIPTAAGFEDFVSMAPTSGIMLKQILTNCFHIIAIEMIASAQAIDIRQTRDMIGSRGKAVYDIIRSVVPMVVQDRVLATDVELLASQLMEARLESCAPDVLKSAEAVA